MLFFPSFTSSYTGVLSNLLLSVATWTSFFSGEDAFNVLFFWHRIPIKSPIRRTGNAVNVLAIRQLAIIYLVREEAAHAWVIDSLPGGALI